MNSPFVTPRAVALVVGATLCFVTLDAMMKQLTRYYNVPFLVWARYGIQALLMIAWLVPGRGRGILRTRHPRLQILRGLALTFSSFAFFAALTRMPLAEAVALNYLAPVIVVGLAALFLGERMTSDRWIMLGGCLVGMLLIVRPGTSALGPGAGLALTAALFYGCFQVLTRRLAGDDPMVTLFYPAVCGTLVLTLLLPLYWPEASLSGAHVAAIMLVGALGTFGHYLFILAFRCAPASGLAPFTYMQLVWATLVGWVAFGSFPDAPALVGMVVIAGSGVYLALRERNGRAERVLAPEGAD
jgi:drug/metabolite transporter (DMT)-like permease